MSLLRDLRVIRLFGRGQRCLSFRVKIPIAEMRWCRQQIGLASETVQEPGQPSGRRVGHSAQDDRESRAVLTVFDDDPFPLPVR